MAKIIKKENIKKSHDSPEVKKWQSVDGEGKKKRASVVIKKGDSDQEKAAAGEEVFSNDEGTQVIPLRKNGIVEGVRIYCSCGRKIEVTFEYEKNLESGFSE